MERTRFRSTSLVDLQAELHQLDLLRDAERRSSAARSVPRRRSLPFGLSVIRRRLAG